MPELVKRLRLIGSGIFADGVLGDGGRAIVRVA